MGGKYTDIAKDRTRPKAITFKLFMILPAYNICVQIEQNV